MKVSEMKMIVEEVLRRYGDIEVVTITDDSKDVLVTEGLSAAVYTGKTAPEVVMYLEDAVTEGS